MTGTQVREALPADHYAPRYDVMQTRHLVTAVPADAPVEPVFALLTGETRLQFEDEATFRPYWRLLRAVRRTVS